jgi:large subunit ribosomal protein L4e
MQVNFPFYLFFEPNISHARLPRIHTSGYLNYRVRRVPQSVKGRRAHPPKTMKNWVQKINKKESLLAFKSALSATVLDDYIKERGHLINGIKLPLVVDDKIQLIKKTQDVKEFLINLGLEKELERTKQKKVRKGKGKRRGRKYKRKIGPLIVAAEDKGIKKGGKNISGVDVRLVKELTIKDLAPGSNPGRLTIYSKSAIKSLEGFSNGSV